jgi:hypothetical protein
MYGRADLPSVAVAARTAGRFVDELVAVGSLRAAQS